MKQTSLPHILVPTPLLLNPGLPAAALRTYIQLRWLAGESDCTTPVPLEKLVQLTGRRPATLHNHFSHLRSLGALEWSSLPEGLVFCFPEPAPAAGATSSTNPDRTAPLADNFPKIQIPGNTQPASLLNNLTKLDSIDKARAAPAGISGKPENISRRKPTGARARSQRGAGSPDAPADTPVGIYQRQTGLRPNAAQRDIISRQVVDLDSWRATLAHWQAHNWNPKNIPGILELYARGGSEACLYCGNKANTPAEPPDPIATLRQEILARRQLESTNPPDPPQEPDHDQ